MRPSCLSHQQNNDNRIFSDLLILLSLPPFPLLVKVFWLGWLESVVCMEVSPSNLELSVQTQGNLQNLGHYLLNPEIKPLNPINHT